MARRGIGLRLVAAAMALGCDDPPAPTSLFEGVGRAQDIVALRERVLVANDVEEALALPGGSVPPERLHDLLVLAPGGEGLVLEGVFDAPAVPARRFSRRLALSGSTGLAGLALGDGSGTGRVQIVDLADPAHPVARGAIEVGSPVAGLAMEDGLLATVGPGGLQLFDVRDADAPLPLGRFQPAEDAGLADVVLDGGMAFVAGTAGALPTLFLQPRLLLVDVTDPEAPALLGEHRLASAFQGLGVTVRVRGAQAFLLGDLGLDVVDVSDPFFPYRVGGIAPAVRPLAGLYTDLELAGDAALLATRGAGLEAVDLSFPPLPLLLTTYPGTSAAGSRAVAVVKQGVSAHVALDRAGIRTLAVDADGDGILTVADVCPEAPDPLQADVDFDGVGDACDVCTQAWDPLQTDADGDGFGNRCDADLDGNGIVNFADLALLRRVFFGADPTADLDGDGAVNFGDLARMRQGFFQPPGPSARGGLAAPR